MSQTTEAAPKKQSKAGNIIVTVILVLAIILVIICSYSAFVAKAGDGVPSIFGIMPFSVQSDSMAPTFNKGDLVIDKTVKDVSTLKEGDVITFWTVINGYRVLNTHRIIQVDDMGTYYYFETKGDNNTIADTTGVHSNEVVGQYMTHIPKLGAFLDFLQTSKGFFICIVIPVALFFLYELVVFLKALSAYNKEKMRMELQAEAAAMAAAMAQQAPAAQVQPASAAPAEAPAAPAEAAPAPETAEKE